MSSINGYEYNKSDSHNSPNGIWYKAYQGTTPYFLKKFTWPKYPKEGVNPELYKSMKSEVDDWMDQKTKIKAALDEIGNGTGNIVSPREIFREKLSFYQVTHWVEPSISSLEAICHLSDDDKLMILQTFSSALGKVHKQGIIHGDLKPENIVIGRSASGKPTAKIIDFDDSYFSGKAFPPDKTVVTEAYQSPELAAYKRGHAEYREILQCASDVFASGIIFHQFWCGSMPQYKGMGEGKFLFEAVSSGDGYQIDKSIPNWLKELIDQMLQTDPKKRPSMTIVHRWINEQKNPVERVEPVSVPASKLKVVPYSISDSKSVVETVKSVHSSTGVPEDLSVYTSKSVAVLKKELKFFDENKSLLGAEYCQKRIQKAVDKLILRTEIGVESEISYKVCDTIPSSYSKIEIISDKKVKAYKKDGGVSTLPVITALGMKLICKK